MARYRLALVEFQDGEWWSFIWQKDSAPYELAGVIPTNDREHMGYLLAEQDDELESEIDLESPPLMESADHESEARRSMVTMLTTYQLQSEADRLVAELGVDCYVVIASEAKQLGGLTSRYAKILTDLMHPFVQADFVLGLVKGARTIDLYGTDVVLHSHRSILAARRDGGYDLGNAVIHLFSELAWLTASACDVGLDAVMNFSLAFVRGFGA